MAKGTKARWAQEQLRLQLPACGGAHKTDGAGGGWGHEGMAKGTKARRAQEQLRLQLLACGAARSMDRKR